jgi:hypothetical protein
MNLPLSLIIECLVAMLLLITIGYCMLLNSRLKRLRADEEGLRATIAELLTATEIAERAIHGLRAASGECENVLGRRLHEATSMSDELSTKMTAADTIVQRISKLAAAGRSPAPVPGMGDPAHGHSMPPARGLPPSPAMVGAGQAPVQAATPARRLDDAARALQSRLQRIAS